MRETKSEQVFARHPVCEDTHSFLSQLCRERGAAEWQLGYLNKGYLEKVTEVINGK
jgi:hypothetical protein